MISVEEAKGLVREQVGALPPVRVPLPQAAGRILAESVVSAIDFPPFDQSNVDGYAIRFQDASRRLKVAGESAAGNSQAQTLEPLQAVRIFTGAPVPFHADTIVMQEKVQLENGWIRVEDGGLQPGSNFRARGTDIRRGDIAFEPGRQLSAVAIGFLASLGIAEVPVYPEPRISLILTGTELRPPGAPLRPGEVYESNSFMLQAALKRLHFSTAAACHVVDNSEQLTAALQAALESSDLVLLCGGVSVGAYDFVPEAANRCGIRKWFHGVRQRPGKPLYFGTGENKTVFGLPGNPSSVVTCFYQYVVPALHRMTRTGETGSVRASLKSGYRKAAGLTFFLKGLYDETGVAILGAQESYRLSSFANANCLVRLDEDRTAFEAGEEVLIDLLP